MLLSEADIRLLKEVGYDPRDFVRFNRQGLAQLRNCRGYCVFYCVQERSCNVYRYRPLGCRIYPVIYSEEEGVIVDDICPMMGTVSAGEVNLKTRKLLRLLQAIDKEAGKLSSSA